MRREEDNAAVSERGYANKDHIDRRGDHCETHDRVFHPGVVDPVPDPEGDVRISTRLGWEREPSGGKLAPELTHARGGQMIQRQFERERHRPQYLASNYALRQQFLQGAWGLHEWRPRGTG